MNDHNDAFVFQGEDSLNYLVGDYSLLIAAIVFVGLVVAIWRLSGRFWLSLLGVCAFTVALYEISYRLSDRGDVLGDSAFSVYRVLESGRLKVSIWSEDERFRAPVDDAIDRGRSIFHPQPKGEQ